MVRYSVDLWTGPVLKKLTKIGRDMPEINRGIMGLIGFEVITRANNEYMRGPRPHKLGHISGDLAASLHEKKTGNIWRYGNGYLEIGTNLPYAARWEFGGVTKKGTKLLPRPYLGPALNDTFRSGKAQLIADRELQRQFNRRD